MFAPLPCTSAHVASVLSLSVPEWERMLDRSARHGIVILETKCPSSVMTHRLPSDYVCVPHAIVMGIIEKFVRYYHLPINWAPPKGHVFRFFAGHFNREVPSSGVWSGWVTSDLLVLDRLFPGLPFELAHDVIEVVGHLIFRAGFPAFVLVGEGFNTEVADWLCNAKSKFWRPYDSSRSVSDQLDIQLITPRFFSGDLLQLA